MDIEILLKQIIDNQFILNRKIDELIKINSELTNTIVKYDEDYQNQIATEFNKET